MAVFRGVSDSSVTNNLFVNFGYRYENPVGIQCQFCSDMTLRDNCIYIEGAQKNFLKTAKESCTNITEENNEYRYTRE